MKQSVVVEMTTEEIAERIDVESSALDQLLMNHTVSPLENPISIREKRRAIARLKTELRKREVTAESN